MKKTLFAFVMLAVFLTSANAQKKVGTIYSEHELIEKSRALLKAFVAGDEDAFLSFYADSVFMTSNGDPGRLLAKKQLLNNMNWWHSDFENLEIHDQKPAYPDALDYKEGADWVQDWTVMTATHTESGIYVELPVHRLYAFNSDGKITMQVNYFNNDIFQQIREAYTTTENGTVYDNHPYIATTRKVVNAFRNGDADAYMSYFADDAEFGYSWDVFGKRHSADENRAGLKRMFSDGYKGMVEETGYPDCVYYEKGNNYVVYSWWKHTREKDGKRYEFPIMLAHTYNDDGKIVFEAVYGSSNHFE